MFRLWPGGLFEGFLHPINISGVFSSTSPVSFPFAALLSHIYNYGDSKTLAINWLSKFKTKFLSAEFQTSNFSLRKIALTFQSEKPSKRKWPNFKLINHFVSCVQKRPLTFFCCQCYRSHNSHNLSFTFLDFFTDYYSVPLFGKNVLQVRK